jgi:hypothetical protein
VAISHFRVAPPLLPVVFTSSVASFSVLPLLST